MRRPFGLLLLLCLPLVPVFADALPITDSGILNLTVTNLAITSSPFCLSFTGSATCSTGTTPFSVNGFSNLFSTVSSTTDQIKDLSSTTGTVSDFETVEGAGALVGQTIHFNLVSLEVNGPTASGNCSSGALHICTPANSPFTVTEGPGGSQLTVSFTANLDAYTGGPGSGFTPYQAVFSTQLAGTFTGSNACSGLAANITEFVTCETGGGTIDAVWSATESPNPNTITTTPEPMSFALLGSVLLALTPRLRRRRSSQA